MDVDNNDAPVAAAKVTVISHPVVDSPVVDRASVEVSAGQEIVGQILFYAAPSSVTLKTSLR